jgi:hypothetical protein
MGKKEKEVSKAKREDERTRHTVAVVLAAISEMERRRIERRADDIAALDLVVARRIARSCGYPPGFADRMLRSMCYVDVVDLLRASVARVV